MKMITSNQKKRLRKETYIQKKVMFNANHSQEEKIISILIGNQLCAAEIAAAMEFSVSSTKRKVKSLIVKGYIQIIGKTRSTRYRRYQRTY